MIPPPTVFTTHPIFLPLIAVVVEQSSASLALVFISFFCYCSFSFALACRLLSFFCFCQSLLFSFILCFYSRVGLMTCYDFSIVCQVYTSRWLWPWWWNRRSCFLEQLGEVVSKLKFDCRSGSCCRRTRALARCSVVTSSAGLIFA